MPDQCTARRTLVIASGVQGQFAEQLAILGDDAHVSARNQKDDLLAPALEADVEMTEAAEVAESDAAFGVEPVAADAVIDLGLGHGR
jgi:hypothetical protein